MIRLHGGTTKRNLFWPPMRAKAPISSALATRTLPITQRRGLFSRLPNHLQYYLLLLRTSSKTSGLAPHTKERSGASPRIPKRGFYFLINHSSKNWDGIKPKLTNCQNE